MKEKFYTKHIFTKLRNFLKKIFFYFDDLIMMKRCIIQTYLEIFFKRSNKLACNKLFSRYVQILEYLHAHFGPCLKKPMMQNSLVLTNKKY